jgi:hypothetical protein
MNTPTQNDSPTRTAANIATAARRRVKGLCKSPPHTERGSIAGFDAAHWQAVRSSGDTNIGDCYFREKVRRRHCAWRVVLQMSLEAWVHERLLEVRD